MRLNLSATSLLLTSVLAIGCQNTSKNGDVVGVAGDDHGDVACALPEIESKPAAAPTAAAPKVAKTYANFGEAQKLKESDAVPIATVLANPAEYDGKYVRMTGVVTSVCPKKGCWMRVSPANGKPGDANVFLKFPDPPEGMYIPLEAVGKEAVIEGTVKNGKLSQAAARHFKQDAGASAEEIEKIQGPQQQVMLAQPAVAIEGVTKTN